MMLHYQDWTCQICKSKVRQDIYPCPTCQGNQNYNKQPQKPIKNKCSQCTFENPQFVTHCQVCYVALNSESQVPLFFDKKPSLSVTCSHCNKENDIANEECVFCENDLFDVPKKACPICTFKVKQRLFNDHYSSCLLTQQILEKQKAEIIQKEAEQKKRRQMESKSKNLQECIHCRMKMLPKQASAHAKTCRERSMKDLVFDEKTRMTSLQIQAMLYMNNKSQRQHNQVKSALQARIKKLGFTIEDLNNLQFYIENYAPIIIHIHISKHMEFFIKDTHYRSQFQTNKSSGSLSRPSRIGWEDRMFDKKYSKAADFERVKYGVINFTNDPKGVNACVSYGQSYFLMKDHVRERCTFTDKDSSNADSSIATFKYCFKILSKMNDNELRAAFDASKAKEIASNCTATYKEIQIHGPIEFSKDILRIYINKNEVKGNNKLLDMVYDFSKKNNIDHDFF